MVGSDLSDDDANSTKLEGKKLRKRGVVIDGEYIEIDDDSPAVGKDTKRAQTAGQEYFIERDFGDESPEEREERLKKERDAAKRQQQEELQKQEQQRKQELVKEPNKVLDKIEQGVMMSQNRGKPLNEMEFKRDGVETSREKSELREGPQEKKNDLAGAFLAVGDNVKKMDFKGQELPGLAEQQKYKLTKADIQGAVPATKVPDVRDKENGRGVDNER